MIQSLFRAWLMTLLGAGLLSWTTLALGASNAALPPNTMTLAKLVGQTNPIDLRGTQTIFPVYIPLSERMVPDKVVLHLEYVNSIALVGERSQLVVKLNESVVAQIPLNPARPEGIADIRLPSKRFKSGYNLISFNIVQHYESNCEDPDAPELWSQLDTQNSYVKFEGELAKVNPKLSEIDSLFDQRWLGDYQLTVATPVFPTSDYATWGAMVSQAAAVHLEYKTPQIFHEVLQYKNTSDQKRLKNYQFPYLDQKPLRGRDAIIIGTQADLQQMLGSRWSSTVSGPYLGVFPMDEDPQHFIMVVSGIQAEDVAIAARILGYMNFPLPDQAVANFNGLKMDHLPRFAASNMVSQNTTYRLYDFGYETTTMSGAGGGSVDVGIMLPPDTYVAETSSVDLNLHFAYGAGMRGDSVFNIFINGRFENVVRLSEIEGEAVRRHTITIPTRSLKPGMNTLTFAARMMTDSSAECQLRNDANLLFTLYDDTTIEFSGLDSYVEMPNMKLLATTGYPYSYNDDGETTVVGLSSNDSDVLAASWTLMGKLAEVMRHVSTDLQYRLGDLSGLDSDNLIVVGTVQGLDANLLKLAPIKLGEESLLQYARAAEAGQQPRYEGSRLWINADEYGAREFNYVNPSLQGNGLGDFGLLMQFQGGDYANTVTLFTAGSGKNLLATSRELITPEIWSNVQGDVTAWKAGEEEVYARSLGESYHIGQPRFSNWLIYHLSDDPWMFIGVLLLFLLLLALFIRWLLTRFRETHH
jgi:hypothetical protein